MRPTVMENGIDKNFVTALTSSQNHLYAFILSLVANPSAAQDILQETNLVLWQKAGEFRAGADFAPWACTIARYQVMAWMRDHKRDRHRFDPALVDTLAEEAAAVDRSEMDDRIAALRQCLSQLPTSQREIVRRHYEQQRPLSDVAESVGRTGTAVKQLLHRVRRALLQCVRGRMRESESEATR